KTLPEGEAKQLQAHTPQGLPKVLPEPQSAWVNALEQEWLRRYGTR
ncbi:TPA: ABC transporter substrate-binding protein, partial [Enterobacter bugandensis]|nr:ABC transporter substrate-binding protein [Enterobacter bugandensis]